MRRLLGRLLCRYGLHRYQRTGPTPFFYRCIRCQDFRYWYELL